MTRHRTDQVDAQPARNRVGPWRPIVLTLGLTGVLVTLYGVSASGAPSVSDVARTAESTARETCVSIGVKIESGRYPVEGVNDAAVLRLYRADHDGRSEMLVSETYVLKAVAGTDGSLGMSVLVRSGIGVPDEAVSAVNGANAGRTLSASALYDVDPREVLDRCRGKAS